MIDVCIVWLLGIALLQLMAVHSELKTIRKKIENVCGVENVKGVKDGRKLDTNTGTHA